MNTFKYLTSLIGLLILCMCVYFGCKKLDLSSSHLKNSLSSSADQSKSSSYDDDDDDRDDDDPDDDDPDDDFEVVTNKFNMSNSWYESYYGTWKKESYFSVVVNKNTINVTNIRKENSLVKIKPGTYSATDLGDKITARDSAKETIIYQRTSSSRINELKSSNSNYKKGSGIFLFVDSVDSNSQNGSSYSYTFSTPIPFVPRSDLTMDKFENLFGRTLSYNYTIHDDAVLKKDVEFNMKCTFTKDSKKVKIVITNEIPNTSISNDKYRADMYGRFPILKQTTYVIDTQQKRMMSISGEGRTLISQYEGGEKYRSGEIAKVDVVAKLCSYKVEGGSTSSYDCQL